MSATKVTWTHAALALAEKHSFTLKDRHAAERRAEGKNSEVIVEENDVRFVFVNRGNPER